MEAIEMIKTRRSVRRFTEDKVSRETIEAIIDNARMAPSWKNTQTVRYLIVEDKDKIAKIASDCVLGFEFNTKTLSKCDTVVLITQKNGICGYEKDGSFSTSKEKGWEMFDAGVAAQTFCLAAWEKGVGSCIMGVFDEEKLAKLVDLPEGMNIAAMIPIGYPKFNPEPTPRKEVADLVSYV